MFSLYRSKSICSNKAVVWFCEELFKIRMHLLLVYGWRNLQLHKYWYLVTVRIYAILKNLSRERFSYRYCLFFAKMKLSKWFLNTFVDSEFIVASSSSFQEFATRFMKNAFRLLLWFISLSSRSRVGTPRLRDDALMSGICHFILFMPFSNLYICIRSPRSRLLAKIGRFMLRHLSAYCILLR